MCTLKATPRRPGSAPACALLALLFLLLGAPQPAQADDFGKIFGTVAFQRPKDVFAPWLEVQSRNGASSIFGGGTQLKGGKTSSALLSEGGSLRIVTDGVATDYSEEEATKILSYPKVTALIDLKAGDAKATAWGCDLTYDYVKINADYRS